MLRRNSDGYAKDKFQQVNRDILRMGSLTFCPADSVHRGMITPQGLSLCRPSVIETNEIRAMADKHSFPVAFVNLKCVW
jgi:hypothetical protein